MTGHERRAPAADPAARHIDDGLAIAGCRRDASPAMRGWCFQALGRLRTAHGSIEAARIAAGGGHDRDLAAA